MGKITADEVVGAAREAAAKEGGAISRADFERLTGISQYHIYRLFPDGGWKAVRRLAELPRHPMDNEPLTDEDLLAEFYRVADARGSIPTWAAFDSEAQISGDTVRRRFGGLQGTLRKFSEWLQLHHPESKLLEELQTRTKHEIPKPPQAAAVDFRRGEAEWAKGEGPEFGPPLDFRGLRHAPINEQGVVFLFGIVSYELGFIVEAVHASFPDCEAKRCVDRSRDRWQRVRIEFEYRSTNFRDHGHDPDGCDLIVCWEHNWLDCPLEVVELRSLIGELDG